MKEAEAKPSILNTQTLHKDIAPGPLAQDDSLQQHRKESREMLQQKPLTREMLNQQNATNPAGTGVSHSQVEESQPRPAGANYADQVAAYRDAQRHADISNNSGLNNNNFSAGRGGAGGAGHALASVLRFMPALITVLLIGAVVVFASSSAQFQSMLPWSKSADTKTAVEDDPEVLIKAGKLAQAVSLMKAMKAQGKLPADLVDKYNTTCVSLGKVYMKDKKYSEAIAVLQQVPSKSNAGKDAKDLLRKAKRLAK
jgi:hypothetical protein